jgi:hypothetical protein
LVHNAASSRLTDYKLGVIFRVVKVKVVVHDVALTAFVIIYEVAKEVEVDEAITNVRCLS